MNDPMFLIDQRSASLAAADDDVRDWASGRRVFVSSLITDMPDERAAVRAAIEGVGATAVMFEDLGAQDVPAEQAYLAGVRSSDIYVGMWGPRYGVRMSDGYSATEAEFRAAESSGLRLCLFVRGETSGEMDGPQRDLIQGARNLYTTSPWADPADLGLRVGARLRELATEELAPWVRVGQALFRARRITHDGSIVTLSASVRSPAVHAELGRLRDNRVGNVPFASPHLALAAQMTSLSSTTVSTTSHFEEVVLTTQSRGGGSMRVSINGLSADQLARESLSDGLFGTDHLGPQIGRMVGPLDPLAPLRGLGLDDSVLRPVARLLFGEVLLTEGIASTVDAFTLGPSHQGTRRLRATWTPPQVYANAEPTSPISIDGSVTGL